MRKEQIFGYVLGTTYSTIARVAQQLLLEHDAPVTFEQFKVLNYLNFSPGLNQQTMADMLHKEKPTVARILRTLEEKKLIIRKVDSNDRRNNLIFISKKGEEVVTEFRPVVLEVQCRVRSVIGEEAFDETIERLLEIRTAFKEALIESEDE